VKNAVDWMVGAACAHDAEIPIAIAVSVLWNLFI
jgi:hypothetical protein